MVVERYRMVEAIKLMKVRNEGFLREKRHFSYCKIYFRLLVLENEMILLTGRLILLLNF